MLLRNKMLQLKIVLFITTQKLGTQGAIIMKHPTSMLLLLVLVLLFAIVPLAVPCVSPGHAVRSYTPWNGHWWRWEGSVRSKSFQQRVLLLPALHQPFSNVSSRPRHSTDRIATDVQVRTSVDASTKELAYSEGLVVGNSDIVHGIQQVCSLHDRCFNALGAREEAVIQQWKGHLAGMLV